MNGTSTRCAASTKAKHDALLAALEPLEGAFSVSGEYAGIHILLKSREELSEEEMVARAAEKGVRVYGLSEFDIRTRKEEKEAGTVLLGYASLGKRKSRKARRCCAPLTARSDPPCRRTGPARRQRLHLRSK